MSDDLASQSLGYTPGNKLSLWERRQQYESWLASNRRAPKPIPQLHTGVAHTRVDDKEPKRSHHRKEQPDTITPLTPGAVIRTDDEPGENKEISDDLRLNFAKALLPKIESSDPATAERLTNAAQAMLGPMVRADDDADAKNRVIGQGPVKKGPGTATAKDDDDEEGEPDKDKAKARKAPDDDDEKTEPSFREVMDAIKNLGQRLDAIEKKPDDDDDDDDGAPAPSEGTPPRPCG